MILKQQLLPPILRLYFFNQPVMFLNKIFYFAVHIVVVFLAHEKSIKQKYYEQAKQNQNKFVDNLYWFLELINDDFGFVNFMHSFSEHKGRTFQKIIVKNSSDLNLLKPSIF